MVVDRFWALAALMAEVSLFLASLYFSQHGPWLSLVSWPV